MLRTHTCGDLRKRDIKKEVTLSGWCHSRRDHGGIIFIDLRDMYGLTQVVFDPSHNKDIHSDAETLRREFVIKVRGHVRARKEGMTNPKLDTGEIEVLVDELDILSRSEVPPLEIDDRVHVNEDFRLKYRYLDLRKPVMQNNIITRHKAVMAVRDYLNGLGFLDIETPILARSTPEGARDYLVPSRVHSGKFFALPQSPQLFKQTLMISGFDRYYQMARCFRDEDLRADRQPEFTQVDIEMAFIQEEDIYNLVEGMLKNIWKDILGVEVKVPFPRMTYDEAMKRYGIDRPDTRFELELIEIPNELIMKSDFEVFKNAVSNGGMVKCINAKGCAGFSRKDIDELTNHVSIYGAKGLAW
ncbi:aspartate--tRNA ligase, partial [Candidatus Woesearchaeota archaeon]